jgi:hypothetical protein
MDRWIMDAEREGKIDGWMDGWMGAQLPTNSRLHHQVVS